MAFRNVTKSGTGESDLGKDQGAKVMPGAGIRARIVTRLARTRFVREALEEKADLSALCAKLTPRVWVGLGLIGLSYIIGWPAIGLLAIIAYHLREPVIVAVGGPVTYGLSHLVFLAGSWLAGSHYASIFLRWTTRRFIEKMGGAPPPPCTCPPPG